MMCHRMGRPPTSTIGLGRREGSSLSRGPRTPARIMAFTQSPYSHSIGNVLWRDLFCALKVIRYLTPSLCTGSGARFDCIAGVGIENRVHGISGAAKGKMLMAEVACGH